MRNLIKTRLAESKKMTGFVKLTICMAVLLCLGFTANVFAVPTLLTTLTGDTVDGGSNLLTTPLTTSRGDITYSGEFKWGSSDPEFTAAGASENTFNILKPGDLTAELFFDFDVHSLNFIYGGNVGDIQITARDKDGGLVAFYSDPDTNLLIPNGGSAGPITLTRTSGYAIRSLYWTDTKNSIGYAALDNIKVYVGVIPAPTAFVLAGIGVSFVGWFRRHKLV